MRLALIAFCLGVAWVQQQAALPEARWLWILPLLSAAVLLPRASAGAVSVVRKALLLLLAGAVGVAWATWRAELRLDDVLPAHWQGVDIEMVGVIADLPQANARGERIVLDVEEILTPAAPALGRIQLTRYWPRKGSREAVMQAGERWQLTVRLKRPHGTHNPHGFDTEAWMLERGIAGSGSIRTKPPPRRLDAQAATFGARVASMRAGVRDRIRTTLADAPYAGVIVALVVGDQRSIPHAQWRVFTRTGVNHLLSISGLHVTMIAALAGWAAASLWRRWPRATERVPARQAGLVAAVTAASAYALLAGFQIPAQRTLFMLIVVAVALWGRREPRPFSALIWALFIVLVIDPWAVLSAGFWLSFGAMAAILWVTFGRIALPGKLRGWITVQAGVTLALAPVLLLLFQQASLISPLANAVAIPLVSWLVTPLALLGVLAPPLWHVAAWLMDGLGHALAWASDARWAVASLPAPDAWAIALALVGSAWLFMPRGFPLRALGVVLWLPLLFPHSDRLAPGTFEADVIDVAQGTAILVRTAGHSLLYDTGPSYGDSDAGERIVVPYLRSLGVSTLSGLIVSHDDDDHSGGMLSVVRDLPTRWVLHGMPLASPLLAGAPHPRRCVRGQAWTWEGVRFEILNPRVEAYDDERRRDNDFSCVLKVSRKDSTLLITGDAERRGELELVESGADLRSTVLVAGHHGSRTSSIEEFIAVVQPEIGVFSMAYRNRFNHPHPQVVARLRNHGAQLLRTDTGGRIRLTFGDAGVVASEYRPTHRRYWHDSAP